MDREPRDPLGLSDLPMIDPPTDGWADVRAALQQDQGQAQERSVGRHRGFAAGLAAAACLMLVAGLVFFPGGDRGMPGTAEGLAEHDASVSTELAANPEDDRPQSEVSVGELIALSQGLERRLRTLRNTTTAMPADSAVYLAELEDLIARVDSQLSDTPGSIDLWSQRVNLMLDIEALFQHQFEREYGKMASL